MRSIFFAVIDPAYRLRLSRTDPGYLARLEEADALRDAFASEFGVREIRWSGYNLSRLLRSTGERPQRVAEMRAILGRLGMGPDPRYPGCGGAFDHGEIWGRGRTPLMLVGHPYGIDAAERALLAELARYTTLTVSVDDRPSYYGHGTHHVRVALSEVRRPFAKPPSTHKTRKAAHAARRAFAEEFES